MQLNCYISYYEWELAYCDIKKLQLSGNVFTTVRFVFRISILTCNVYA